MKFTKRLIIYLFIGIGYLSLTACASHMTQADRSDWDDDDFLFAETETQQTPEKAQPQNKETLAKKPSAIAPTPKPLPPVASASSLQPSSIQQAPGLEQEITHSVVPTPSFNASSNYRPNTNQSAIHSSLPREISSLLSRRGLARSGIGVFIQPVDGGAPLLSVNADSPKNPASVMKLLTTYSALGMLGPDFRWPVKVFTLGEMRGDTLYGDLAIKGYGYPQFVTEDLESIIYDLQNQGLRHIQGNLIVDNSFFEVPWEAPFDKNVYSPYNAKPDAILINHGATKFVVKPNRSTGRIEAFAELPANNLKIINNIRKSTGRCSGKRKRVYMKILSSGDNPKVKFTGRYSTRCGEKHFYKVVAKSPNTVLGGFRKLWKQNGGTISGASRIQKIDDRRPPFYTWQSQTLPEIVRLVNKKSNNVMARQLLLTMGAHANGGPSSPDSGEQAMQSWFQSQHLNFPELDVDNGSGLSRSARVSARSVAGMLLKAWHTDGLQQDLQHSLPIMGQDGTLKRRMRNSELNGNAFMKTGTLRDTRAIAGYINASDGRTYVAVILHNDPAVRAKGRAVHDKLLQWTYWQDGSNYSPAYASSDSGNSGTCKGC